MEVNGTLEIPQRNVLRCHGDSLYFFTIEMRACRAIFAIHPPGAATAALSAEVKGGKKKLVTKDTRR